MGPSKQRVLRDPKLLAPTWTGHPHDPTAPHGTITIGQPEQILAMDTTTTITTRNGSARFFLVIDRCTAEYLGIYATAHARRLVAGEPARQAVMAAFGTGDPGAPLGVMGHHQHWSEFVSSRLQRELALLGAVFTPIDEANLNGRGEAIGTRIGASWKDPPTRSRPTSRESSHHLRIERSCYSTRAWCGRSGE